MIIHVIEPDETIESIAAKYNMSIQRLLQDNGLEYQEDLVVGQSIVVAKPSLTYTVKDGDSLDEIASSHNVTPMELLRNNPWLFDREHIFPGDVLVISYDRTRTITTHGNTLPYVNIDILEKTLPYLTYLSIMNYTATVGGEIITYIDDSQIVDLAKAYNVMPLMLLTTLSSRGEADIRAEYELLLDEDIQDKQIENVINILKAKGYYGVNISFQYIEYSNIPLYEKFYTKFANRLNEEGFFAFATINPSISFANSDINFARIDYTKVNQLAQGVIVFRNDTAMFTEPPSPISSIRVIETYLAYLLNYISPDKIVVGAITHGLDWELPFYAGISSVNLVSYERAIHLARSHEVIIYFDEVSKNPYFRYTLSSNGKQIEHIVWFVDARTINGLLEIVNEHDLGGTAIWNIMNYNPQFWLMINSQYEIEKIQI